MEEEKKTRDVIDAVTGVVKAVPIYQDAAQPAAIEIGKGLQTLAKTVHVALAPVSILVWGYDEIKDFVSNKVTEKLRNIPEENIISPKPNVAGPALESLKYTGHDSSLSDLYANLLASSMDKTSASGAHPAFVEIIKQLTPDEAKLIKYLSEPTGFPLITAGWTYKNPTPQKRGGHDLVINFSLLGNHAKLEFPELTPSYINNLCRLGLTEIPTMIHYTNDEIYKALESAPEILKVKAEVEADPERKFEVKKELHRFTELGKQFYKVCVSRS